jgi:hypothetical protein
MFTCYHGTKKMANAQKIFLQMHEQNKHTPPDEGYAFTG